MVKSKRKQKQFEYPLSDLKNKFYDKNMLDILDFIDFNLKHTLRKYQNEALHYLVYSQNDDKKHNHLLFNMATGSGKTDLMAAVILLMYKQGYQEFLFTVNTNAVISKTRENLINSSSSKYLFNLPIVIDGEKIEIREVNNFPINKEPGVIYIKLVTIQTLTNELNQPVENGITDVELQNHQIVILADEAHHLSATTKDKNRTTALAKKICSWENTINSVLNSNSNNKLFEFTATIDWDDERLYDKYIDKLIYKYDLSKFINDGYSKNVFRLQANSDDEYKMLNAVLLSQYRKYIATSHQIENFKPVILFKSNKIKISQKENEKFVNLIKGLNVEDLAKFIENQKEINKSHALKMAYSYFEKQDLSKVVTTIKRDFDKKNIINVNISDNKDILDDSENFDKLNSLEDANNPFRVVFAVAKLSEGWDVLNLYDIVKVGESKGTITETNQEAQLIGRGARYYPFKVDGQKSYTRRFDNSSDPELKLLENLYYHTSNSSKYLNNLKKSLDKLDLIVHEDGLKEKVYEAKLKSSFKKSKIYHDGNFYYNELEEIPEKDFNGLIKYGIDTRNVYEVDLTKSILEANYRDDIKDNSSQTKTIRVKEIGKYTKDYRLVNKAISRNKFYRFNSMKKYMPTLKSIKEFITSPSWLGSVRLDVRVDQNKCTLSPNEKLHAVEEYLSFVQKKITHNFKRSRGTNQFKSIKISDVIKDYSKTVPQSFNTIDAVIEPHKVNEKWFAFDYAIVDKLEASLINLIRNFIDELKNKYNDVYLFRIDEQNTKFKLHDFGKNAVHFEGFMPDFILYLGNEEIVYQLYIEPKGEQLIQRDKWKEELLERISPENIELLDETDNLKLYGVKFYRSGDINNVEQEIKDKANITQED